MSKPLSFAGTQKTEATEKVGGRYAENKNSDSFKLLQPLSEEVADGKGKPGQFILTQKGTVVDEIIAVPLDMVVLWDVCGSKPANELYPPVKQSFLSKEEAHENMEAGDAVQERHLQLLKMWEPTSETWVDAVIYCQATKLRFSRSLSTKIASMDEIETQSLLFKIGSRLETNKNGQKYYNLTVDYLQDDKNAQLFLTDTDLLEKFKIQAKGVASQTSARILAEPASIPAIEDKSGDY